MSTFGGLVLTNRGLLLQSKAQSGVELKYTRVAVGDGQLGTTSILQMNKLINEVKSLPINKLKVLDAGRAVVGAVLTNQELTAGFYYREIGVFALDPDVGEILYCYGNAGNLAEYIPTSGSDIIEKNIDIQTVIGRASNISAVIDASLVWETAMGAQEKADRAEENAVAYTDSKTLEVGKVAESKYTKPITGIPKTDMTSDVQTSLKKAETALQSVTKSDIGLGNVQNYGLATQAEAEAGTSVTKYMTPQHTKQAIDKNLITISQSVTDLEEQVTQHLDETEWFTATIQNGWTATILYNKDAHGIVCIAGFLVNAGTSDNGSLLATLPVGFRPTYGAVAAVRLSNLSPFNLENGVGITDLGEIRIYNPLASLTAGKTNLGLSFSITYKAKAV